jgi:D-glycero-D-manno-heptose 1,7-bisphosphate phosphatase
LNKVVFLDRDGVINFETGDYTYQIEKFKILPDLFKALEILKNKGFKFIVITNQGGISKQRYNHNAVKSVHEFMQEQFKQAQIDLLDIYYCPHHSEIEKCICRKPNSQLLEKAIARYNVDKTKSYFVGDTERDIIAADRVGVTGIKVNKNDSLLNYLHLIR